jgi:hypothetical protein
VKRKYFYEMVIPLKVLLLNLELHTFVKLVYNAFTVKNIRAGKRLLFDR